MFNKRIKNYTYEIIKDVRFDFQNSINYRFRRMKYFSKFPFQTTKKNLAISEGDLNFKSFKF